MPTRGERQRLTVIAGRTADNARLSFRSGQLTDEVDPAADLKSADRLMVFMFQKKS